MPSRPHGHIRIARIFGAPVYLHPSWWLVFGLLTWTLAHGYFAPRDPEAAGGQLWAQALAASLLFFASILLHEAGHALVALRHGIGIQSITLFVFGGVARLARDPADGLTELKVAAAGPVVSLALAGAFGAVAALLGRGAVGDVALYLAVINFVVAIFNLAPAFPLDGGRMLRGLLWSSQGRAQATRVAAGAGTFFAFALMGMGLVALLRGQPVSGVWSLLLGWFLHEASGSAYHRALLDEILREMTVRDAMHADPVTLPAHISVNEAAHDRVIHTGYGGYPVLRGEQVVGLLCLRDILRLPPKERDGTPVQAIMTPLSPAIVVAPGDPMLAAMGKMAEAGTGRLLVLENGRLVGLLTMNSVIRHVRVREELAS